MWNVFGSAKRKEWEKELLERVDEINRCLDGQADTIASLEKNTDDRTQNMMMQLKRHNANIDNLIDEMEEYKERQEQLFERTGVLRDKEQGFLKLFFVYQETLFSLKRVLCTENAPEWTEQFNMIENTLGMHMAACGIGVIDGYDVPADPELHEVIEVKQTENGNMPASVAEVIRPGCTYMGKVVRKAQVVAERGGEKMV